MLNGYKDRSHQVFLSFVYANSLLFSSSFLLLIFNRLFFSSQNIYNNFYYKISGTGPTFTQGGSTCPLPGGVVPNNLQSKIGSILVNKMFMHLVLMDKDRNM